MAGKPNKAWMETMIKKHGSREAVREWQQSIGSLGGKKTGVTKGFAHPNANPSAAGRIGGTISRRKPKEQTNVQA